MRSLTRLCAVLLTLGLVGCAGDPREAKINSVISYLNQSSSDISQIKEKVSDAIKKAENKKLPTKEMKEALSPVESLKTLTKDMQKVKQHIESLAGSTTKEQKDALAEQFRSKLSAAMATLEEERRALEKTIQEAESIDPDGVKELRAKLTEAEGNFVMLAKQR